MIDATVIAASGAQENPFSVVANRDDQDSAAAQPITPPPITTTLDIRKPGR